MKMMIFDGGLSARQMQIHNTIFFFFGKNLIYYNSVRAKIDFCFQYCGCINVINGAVRLLPALRGKKESKCQKM